MSPIPAEAPGRRPGAAAWLAALTAYAALAALFTWPALGAGARAVLGGSDAFYYLWNVAWWNDVATTGDGVWRSASVLHPFGADLAQHDLGLWPTGLAALFTGVGLGLPAAVNAVAVLALWLNAGAMFLLAHRLTRDAGAAFFAGALFGFAPFFVSRLLGHFGLLHAYPLVGLVDCLLRGRHRGSAWWNLAAGGCVVLAAHSHLYYGIYALFVVAAFHLASRFRLESSAVRRAAVTRLAPRLLLGASALALALAIVIRVTGGTTLEIAGRELSLRGSANSLIASWLFAGAAALVVWRVRLRVRAVEDPATAALAVRIGLTAAPLALLAPLAGRLAGLFLRGDLAAQPLPFKGGPPGAFALTALAPNPYQSVWGDAVRQALTGWSLFEHGSNALTWTALTLVVATAAWRRSSGWAWAFAGAFVLSLGPFLRLAPGLDHGPILPYWALRYLPLLSAARMPSRWIAVALLAWAVLAAVAMTRVRSRRLRALALFALLVELAPLPVPTTGTEIPAVYRAIAEDTLPGALLELPFGVRDGRGHWGAEFPAERLYYQTSHRRPLVGGYLSRVPDRVFDAYREMPALAALVALQSADPLAESEARADLAALGRALGIRWVVLDTATASPALVAHCRRELGKPDVDLPPHAAWTLPRKPRRRVKPKEAGSRRAAREERRAIH